MPPKRKTKKETTPALSAWLDKFFRAENITEEVKETLFDQQITSKATFSALTEADLSDLGLLVGQKIIVRQALKRLHVSETNADPSPSVSLTTSTAPMEELADLRDFSEELKYIEAEVTLPDIPAGSKPPQPVSPVQGDNPSKESKQSLLPSKLI